ncbi:DUF2200 domain-containing protein [Staphylococcus chromogenes]|uniref:DUF2200 domain-containing protein n=1 Tax=Staphylococcus chromogenes TaxID=46126 RepID=UPI0021D04DD2|nr:DUF2200 domain-containing protein [Staphylococcus chromogenes]UXS75762.1 DUF2200 domain-containing protein [Staphylococcus chromogenes]
MSQKIFNMKVSGVYPHYITKAEKKGRTKEEVDEIMRWHTGYSQTELESQLKKEVSFETFFNEAPQLNPDRKKVTGVICGILVEDIEDPIVQEVRYLDKMIDELAKGKSLNKIFRA